MSQKVLHGFAWYSYPDILGVEPDSITDPGHPFASPSGDVQVPEEVLYYRPTNAADNGVKNAQRGHSYLVLSQTQFHPRLSDGWESEPAALTEKFKTGDGKVEMAKVVQIHHRHSGDLMECELKIEEA